MTAVLISKDVVGENHGNSAMTAVFNHVTALNLDPETELNLWDSGWTLLAKSICHDAKGGWNGTFRTRLPKAIRGDSQDAPASQPASQDAPKTAPAKKSSVAVELSLYDGTVRLSAEKCFAIIAVDGSVFMSPGASPLLRKIDSALTDIVKFVRENVRRDNEFDLGGIKICAQDSETAKKVIRQRLFDAGEYETLAKIGKLEPTASPSLVDAWISKYHPQ